MATVSTGDGPNMKISSEKNTLVKTTRITDYIHIYIYIYICIYKYIYRNGLFDAFGWFHEISKQLISVLLTSF